MITIMIITIIIIKVGTGPHQERIKMRKGREVERTSKPY